MVFGKNNSEMLYASIKTNFQKSKMQKKKKITRLNKAKKPQIILSSKLMKSKVTLKDMRMNTLKKGADQLSNNEILIKKINLALLNDMMISRLQESLLNS